MSLLEQLRKILAESEILPLNPDAAISGTELLNLVHPKLEGEYSDNSLRQTFSTLSADPTSPIARAERGYGYYRRPSQQQAVISPPAGADSAAKSRSDEEAGRDNQLEEKFAPSMSATQGSRTTFLFVLIISRRHGGKPA